MRRIKFSNESENHCPCLKTVVKNNNDKIMIIFDGVSPSGGQSSFENNVSIPCCDI
jgi:hypothetical protein